MSLRINLAWSALAQILASGLNWASMIVLARLGTPELVGEYSLAVAIATPVMAFAHLNLRSILITDTANEISFRVYRDLRILCLAAGLAVIAAWTLLRPGSAAVVMLLAATQALEWISDLYHGAIQKQERMDRLAVSLGLRGVLTIAAFAAGLASGGGLAASASILLAGRAAILLLYDIPSAALHPATAAPAPGPAMLRLLRTALPLGIALMLGALLNSLPRFLVDRSLGAHALGVFAVIATFASAGNMGVTAIGQAVSPRLAKLIAAGDIEGFKALSAQTIAAGAILAVGGAAVMAVAGPALIEAVFTARYSAPAHVLAALMGAAGLGYVASLSGYVITAAGCFRPQGWVLSIATLAAGITGYWAIPAYGLPGAAISMAAGATIQTVAQLLVLRAALTAGRSVRLAEARA